MIMRFLKTFKNLSYLSHLDVKRRCLITTTVLSKSKSTFFDAFDFVWQRLKQPSSLFIPHADYEQQAVILTDSKVIQPNDIRTSQFPKRNEIKRGEFRSITTLYDLFQCGLYHGSDKPCLGYKLDNSDEYKWLTYLQVDENSIRTGAGIIGLLKQTPGQNTKIGIFMKNCVEWVYIDQGCSRHSMISVPMYVTLDENAAKFILNTAKCEVIFVDSKDKIDLLTNCICELPYLKYIVVVGKIDTSVAINQLGAVKVLPFSDILSYGGNHPVALSLIPKPDDIYTIVFTSGTTGTPKGCPITHKTFLCGMSPSILYLETASFGSKPEIHLSFLPLTHSYERIIQALMFLFSGKIAFFSDDIRYLVDEFKVIRPTIIFAVPRLLNRVYNKVMLRLSDRSFAKYIFEKGLLSKGAEVQRGIIRRTTIWDFLLFKKIQNSLGGRVDIVVVSSAPISDEVLQFFRIVMGCTVLEGYGQTEACGPCTMTLPGDHETGQVGPPLPGILLKLKDVPELGIVTSRDGWGEICVKGDGCIKEYYENPELTHKLIDQDGWLHTGDIGQWTQRGQLKIIDRCKHIFKMAQGVYVAAEKLENIYSLSPLVAQIFVTGDSLKEYCVAIVVPDIDGWRNLGKLYKSLEEICEDKHSVSILLKNLESVGRNNELTGIEIVKRVLLWPYMLTPESGLLTPTLKLKRMEVSRFFKSHIDKLYE